MTIRIPRMIAAELRRLTSTKMAILALVALMAVPVLYGGLYLWANQDPYGSLDKVPVALVVQDVGTTDSDGVFTNSGEEVADQLVEDGTFDWHEVSASEAATGVDDKTYDFSVTLPSDFSAALASSDSDAPYQAAVILTTNDANSYLATTIGEQAAKTIKASVVEKVNEKAASQFLVGLSDIRGSLVTAVDGSGKLLTGSQELIDGAADARSGAAQLADGTGQLLTGAQSAVDGSADLASGLDRLSTGAGTLAAGLADARDQTASLPAQSAQLADGAQQVADGTATLAQKAPALSAGAAQLADGSAQLSAGVATLADGSAQAAAGDAGLATAGDALGTASQNLADQIPTVRDDITTRLTALGLTDEQIADVLARLDPLGTAATDANTAVQGAVAQIDALAAGAQQVADGASALSSASATLATGARTLADGTATLPQDATTLADGAAQVAAGAGTLSEKAPALASGIASAADGSATLSSGLTTASTGADTLASGLVTLRDGEATANTGAISLRDGLGTLGSGLGTLQTGIQSLDDGLTDGVDRIPDNSAAQQDAQSSNIANPVEVDSEAVTEAGTYGAGLAPFFASLAAWIGIYALFLIIKPVSKRAITALHSPIRITLAGWLTPGILGAIQMAALFFILSVTLGFTVDSPIGVYAMMAVASLTFAAIILALNVWLGSVGQFLGLVLMVVQLVTAGGTFPWQTLPAPLAALHHVLPMGFAVDGIRQFMYGGDVAAAWGDAGILGLWALGALLLTAIGVTRMTHSRTLKDLQPSLIG